MKGRQGGFTLVELIVALAVVGMLAGVAFISGLELLPRYRLHAAARDFSSNLRQARMTAIKTGRDVRVVFDLEHQCYTIDGRPVPPWGNLGSYYGSGVRFGFGRAGKSAAASSGTLPENPVTFQGRPKRLTFNSRGLSNPGSVYFTNKQGECCAVVVSTSGRIRLRSWKGAAWR